MDQRYLLGMLACAQPWGGSGLCVGRRMVGRRTVSCGKTVPQHTLRSTPSIYLRQAPTHSGACTGIPHQNFKNTPHAAWPSEFHEYCTVPPWYWGHPWRSPTQRPQTSTQYVGFARRTDDHSGRRKGASAKTGSTSDQNRTVPPDSAAHTLCSTDSQLLAIAISAVYRVQPTVFIIATSPAHVSARFVYPCCTPCMNRGVEKHAPAPVLPCAPVLHTPPRTCPLGISHITSNAYPSAVPAAYAMKLKQCFQNPLYPPQCMAKGVLTAQLSQSCPTHTIPPKSKTHTFSNAEVSHTEKTKGEPNRRLH